MAEPGLEGVVQVDPPVTGAHLYKISGDLEIPGSGDNGTSNVPLATLTLIETSYVLELAPQKFGYEPTPEADAVVSGAKTSIRAVLSRYI